MSKIIVPSNLSIEDHDFFDYNPEMRYFDAVSKLYDDVGPMIASRIMWAVYLTEDTDSDFYGLSIEDRRGQIESNFLKNDIFNWSEYQYLIDSYPEIVMTPAQRRYKKLNDNFDIMLSQLEGQELKDASAFYSKLKSMYEGLSFVEQKYKEERQKEKESTKGKGGMFG